MREKTSKKVSHTKSFNSNGTIAFPGFQCRMAPQHQGSPLASYPCSLSQILSCKIWDRKPGYKARFPLSTYIPPDRFCSQYPFIFLVITA